MSNPSIPSGQAQFAQIAKSVLDFSKQWRELQSAASLQLLHAQLDLLSPRMAGGAARELFDLQSELSNELAAQQKVALRQFNERASAAAGQLRQAQTSDDVTMIAVGFMTEVGKVLRENSEQAMTLLNSVSAASTVLTDRALDEAIGGQPDGKQAE